MRIETAREFDVVIVSDLHLGARNCRADDFLRFMDWAVTPRLVVAGDVFDNGTLRSLQNRHVNVIELLRSFARTQNVTWIKGNHDPSHEYFNGVLGLDSRDETVVESGSARYLVTHGDQWDPSMKLPWWLIAGADACYHGAQAIDKSHRLARLLKKRCKRFVKASDILERRAVIEARRRCLTGVIIGHSHLARDVWRDGVHYLNSGCWTERPTSFVGIRDGVARQYFWDDELHRPMPSPVVDPIPARREESPLEAIAASVVMAGGAITKAAESLTPTLSLEPM